MKKLILLSLILPSLSFSDYKMYDTKEGVFLVSEESGLTYKYHTYNSAPYKTKSGFELEVFHLSLTDEGLTACIGPDAERFVLEAKK